ncbi:MAG: class I SAM-dependent methyltransferase [Pseudomonadales bacterium]|nr:class I SAM-dependent methyltransferase [Pseudomonadales bacterium]
MEQYVILGAGYDTRAHRLTLPSSLTVWEVDQPEVQAIKRAKLPKAQATSATSAQIHYVSIDFNHQCLSEHLLAAGFDTRKSTLFTLEGVSQYITKETFASTMEEIAALTQKTTATFIFSYVDALLKTDPVRCFGKGYPKAKRRADMVMGLAAKVGEPWISLYTEEALVELLAEHGFSVQENKTLEDLNAVYFSPVGRTLTENQIFKLEHFVAATSKKA